MFISFSFFLDSIKQFNIGCVVHSIFGASTGMQTVKFFDQWLERCLKRRRIKTIFICGKFTSPPLFSHVVAFPRLEIPLKGLYENTIEQNNSTVDVCLKPGMALFAAPNCWNLPTWRLKVELISILFGKEHIGISHVISRGSNDPHIKAEKYSTTYPLIGPLPYILDAIVELQSTGGSQEIFLDLVIVLLRCLQDLLRHSKDPSINRSQSLLKGICMYLQSQYQHEITRDSAAQHFSISPNHVSRLFHVHARTTFNNYLTHVRINRSKYFLCNYNLKLGDIAIRCGFRDTPYFCRVFKRVAKVTPAEYRATHRIQ